MPPCNGRRAHSNPLNPLEAEGCCCQVVDLAQLYSLTAYGSQELADTCMHA